MKKISKGMGMLHYGIRYFPQIMVQSMYGSIIEPHFRFCCSVSGVCDATTLNKLQKLQNRAVRIATNSPYGAPSQPLLDKIGWQTIWELIDMEPARMMYRSGQQIMKHPNTLQVCSKSCLNIPLGSFAILKLTLICLS